MCGGVRTFSLFEVSATSLFLARAYLYSTRNTLSFTLLCLGRTKVVGDAHILLTPLRNHGPIIIGPSGKCLYSSYDRNTKVVKEYSL